MLLVFPKHISRLVTLFYIYFPSQHTPIGAALVLQLMAYCLEELHINGDNPLIKKKKLRPNNLISVNNAPINSL